MASASDIPVEIRRFIGACITSVAQLEALLLLAEQRHTDWTATEISAELRSTPGLMMNVLSDLYALGLVAATDTPAEKDGRQETRYRYQPASPLLERTVEGLAEAYRERRHSVLSTIYSPREPSSLRAFSDAFRLRRDREGE
jgi:predicted ArsR family transcriptional regulator